MSKSCNDRCRCTARSKKYTAIVMDHEVVPSPLRLHQSDVWRVAVRLLASRVTVLGKAPHSPTICRPTFRSVSLGEFEQSGTCRPLVSNGSDPGANTASSGDAHHAPCKPTSSNSNGIAMDCMRRTGSFLQSDMTSGLAQVS